MRLGRDVLALALVASTACGRFRFAANEDAPGDGDGDSGSCIPVGHDEDGDGFDDACDVCPQRGTSQLDSDGDGVGDECDLVATTQQRLFFDPFTVARSEWAYNGPHTFVGDALEIDGLAGGNGASLIAPPGRDTFEVTGRVTALGTTMRQLSIAIFDGPAAYYCELYDNGMMLTLLFTYTPDSVTFTTIISMPLVGRLGVGAFRLILDHTPPPTTCISEWNAERSAITGDNPAVAPMNVGTATIGTRVELDSFVQLRTP